MSEDRNKIKQHDERISTPYLVKSDGSLSSHINVMAGYGCFFMSDLGIVQTLTGKIFTADQIRAILNYCLTHTVDTDKGKKPFVEISDTYYMYVWDHGKILETAFLALDKKPVILVGKELKNPTAMLLKTKLPGGLWHAVEGDSQGRFVWNPGVSSGQWVKSWEFEIAWRG